jgi:LuxR family maltose regulon positive regulatory protein
VEAPGRLDDDAIELEQQLAALQRSIGGASSLTAAELRLLPLLPTHLSFRQLGHRLSISANTVKTQALSTSRKFGVSSRSEAVDRARQLGLLVDEPPRHRGVATRDPVVSAVPR